MVRVAAQFIAAGIADTTIEIYLREQGQFYR
jgi:hypothetical protein